MFSPSLIQENILNINYIQRFCDKRIDLTSHDYLMAHLVLDQPFVGHAIVQSEKMSDTEKLNAVIDKLVNRSILGLILGKRRAGKTGLMYRLFHEIHERFPNKPIAVAGVLPNIKGFPPYIKPIIETSEAEEGSIIGFDEAAIRFQCLVPDTLVRTEYGTKEISECVVGDKIFSFDIKNKKVELCPITSKNLSKQDVMKITFENGDVVECSPDHRWYVKKGEISLKQAKDLNIDDALISIE